MDSNSETDVHTRALFMVDFLAFYHWFKNRVAELSTRIQPFLEQLLFQIELHLDFLTSTTESAMDETAKMEHKQKMMALKTAKDELFPDEAEVIVIDGRGEYPADLLAIAMEVMHNEIIKGLIENEQHFLDKLKTIFIDQKRLRIMIPHMSHEYQILIDNAKGEKQHGYENKNNEKKDEEEKGEGREKGDEKGSEKEDERGIEKEDESIGEEGENGRDEKEKEDKKGGEKKDENGIEKKDESIGEKGKKENEDKKGREKVEQNGGSEEEEKEKEKEDKKGREQVEQKGGSEGNEKEKENKEKGGEEDEKGRDEMEKGDKKGKEKVEQKGGSEEEEKEKGDKKGKEKVEQKGGGDEKGGDRGGAENKRCVDSDAESDLISCYKYLMSADQPISKSDQKLLVVNATYYKMKALINGALSTTKQIKSGGRKNNNKLRRMANDIEMTAQKANLLENPKNFDEKLVKICYLYSFWTHVISNRNLYKESEIWRTFLAYGFGGEKNAKRSQQVPMEGEHKWDNSICEKSEKVSEVLQHLLKSPTPEITHEFVLYDLLNKNKEFVHFIYYSLDKMPTLKKMVQFEKDDEMGRLYLALFASADSAAKVFQAEINLGIKMMESQINKLEQLVRNSLNYTEIMMARAKLRATAAVQLHFRHDEKFRIICGQIAYVSYLSQKMDDPFTLWNSPTKCFSISREDTLSALRTAHRECHCDFVINRLASPEENSFLSTVRQKRGTLALLEKLIGGPLLNMLWTTNEAPANALLLDANMAVDYVSDHMRDIKSADLIVWMQWFQSAHEGQAGHSINREFIWLYARVFYDRYGNGFDKYFEGEFSRIEVLMEKITQMHTAATAAFALQKGICCELPEKWRTIINEGTINESILEVIEPEEGKGRKTETNEFVQRLHFDVIRELCQNVDQIEEMVQRKIGNIIKMLKQSKDYRRNLKELMNKEQIKEIFQHIGIPFDEKEFEGTDQQMAFLSDQKIEDQQKKKRKKNRRKKNGQKLGMNEENESEQSLETTESKIEEKEKNEKERTKKEEEKEAMEEKMEEKEKENEKRRKNNKEKEAKEKAEVKEEKMEKKEKEVSKKESELQKKNNNGKEAKEKAGVSQQLIRDEFDEQNSQKLEQFVTERAINGKTADGMPRKKRDKRLKVALDKIKEMAGKWSADQAKLFISGSFLLELNTIDSDFDLICVVPGKMIKKEHFLGEQNEICVEKKCESALNKLINFDGHLFDWSSLLSPNSSDFVEKYENFIAINCIGQDKSTAQNFCQFVETRIRLQLAYDISQRGTTTNWHIYPALYQETCQITQKLEEIPYEIRSDYHHCKLWLIGTDQQLMDINEKRMINMQLLNFDWAIKRDFLKFNGKLSNKLGTDDINDQFNEMRVNLKSVFARNTDIF
ncbi:hypothetical protein niasHS_015827 [Heterodera schachtii]|uniref:Polymerase nucleotidyl transferase domain-containing protein n=1 Tax=Heterodera schachtii TaxID=97005 RepID=A0ABD2I1P1_HETSC